MSPLEWVVRIMFTLWAVLIVVASVDYVTHFTYRWLERTVWTLCGVTLVLACGAILGLVWGVV